MKPHLIPIRVHACVYDPSANRHMGVTIAANGTTTRKPYAWGFRQPDYAGAIEKLHPVWTGFFTEDQKPPAIEKESAGPRICVTWTPAAGWTKPLHNDDPNSLPYLPDRWLVVRMMRTTHEGDGWKDQAPTLRTWIIDSGVKENSGAGAPFLRTEAGAIKAMSAGVVRTQEEAKSKPGNEDREKLTIQGASASSDLTYGAYVPSNLQNLSFIDDLEGLGAERLNDSAISYFVAGWYRSPDDDDPFRELMKKDGLKKDMSAAAIRRKLLLCDPSEETETLNKRQLEERTLFHGMVSYIDFFNPRSYLGPEFGAPHPGEIRTKHPCYVTGRPKPTMVGIGETVEEALAELCAQRSIHVDEAYPELLAPVLKSLLDDSLRAWASPGREDLLSQADRASTFQAIPAGSQWRIAGKEGSDAPEKVPASFYGKLALLNEAQQRLDALKRQESGELETLYTIFWMYRQRERMFERGEPLPGGSPHRHFEKEQAGVANAVVMRRQNATADVAVLKKNLEDVLTQHIDPKSQKQILTLESVELPPFYLPKEPAVALRDIGVRRVARPVEVYGRTAERLAKSGSGREYLKDFPNWKNGLERAAVQEAVIGDYGDPDLATALRGLLTEAAMAEEAVAVLVRVNSEQAAFRGTSRMDEWSKRNGKIFGYMGGSAVYPDGALPANSGQADSMIQFNSGGTGTVGLGDICSFWSQQPWLPMFLDWEAEWTPISADPARKPVPSIIEGRTLLTHRPTTILRDRLEKVRDAAVGFEPKVREALLQGVQKITEWEVVGQSLSGIHQQLLQRNDALPRIMPTDIAPYEDVASVLQGTSLAPPDVSPATAFQPFRQGSLGIPQLRIVDMFGQALVLGNPQLHGRRVEKRRFTVQPRSLEPMRLSVELDGGVRGFVLPSRLDRQVVVYDGKGTPLGLLAERSGKKWFRGLSVARPEDVTDPVLYDCLESMSEPQSFRYWMKTAQEALARTLPARSEGMTSTAALLGRPLAVVRVRVALQRRGGAVCKPDWFRLDENLEAWADATRRSRIFHQSRAGVPTVNVIAGCRHLTDDGVIAYQMWDGLGAGVLHRTAKLGASSPSFTLRLPEQEDEAAGIALTLLMDPFGKAYFDTQILPVTSFALPPESFETVLAALPAVLNVSPLLLGSHAALKQFAEGSQQTMIELPLPLRTQGKGQQPGEQQPRVFLSGIRPEVKVESISPNESVPPAEVASADGILVV